MSVLRKVEFRYNAATAYGKSWQWRLAVAKDLNLRTVQNWARDDDKGVPDDIYRHVANIKHIIVEEDVKDKIGDLVDRLKALGLDEHVIAAQLHTVADRLSPPELRPRDVVSKQKSLSTP